MSSFFIPLAEGVLVGFLIAAPVGPVAVLSIERTLHAGLKVGFVVGLGAAIADTVLGAVAGFGINVISDFLIAYETPLRIAGGAFLLLLGTMLFFARREAVAATPSTAGLLGIFVSSFLVTLFNPITLVAFLAVFAGLGFTVTAAEWASASVLVGGVFLGASLWWFSLSAAVALLRHRVSLETLPRLKRGSGLALLGFGVYALVSGLV
ncbi:MAG: LysE family translocator [Kiloniellales bacterium]|nr:LysE family translocator [Kiloniellales bacterium]